MAFNEYNGMEGYIDPRQLVWAMEGSHEQAGSWAEQQFNNAAMEAQDPVAASLAMEDFPGYQDFLQPQIGWLDAAYSSATRQLLPNDASTLSAPQRVNVAATSRSIYSRECSTSAASIANDGYRAATRHASVRPASTSLRTST